MILSLQKKLQKRQVLGNLRKLEVIQGLIDFSSNDYLGLARSQMLNDMVEREITLHAYSRLGSTGSRLLTGNSTYIQELEDEIATFHGYDAGLIFNCGYMANVGLLSAIANDQDVILFDAAVHASTHDGIRLSLATSYAFRHNDLDHLEKRLANLSSKRNSWICVESIYSMDGSQAPLEEICKLAKRYQAKVIVDEAHAIGVYGPEGAGLVAKKQLTREVFAQVVTFGKALGVHGAIVLGNQVLKETLINFSNAYIYTTALPFHSLAAIKCAYRLFPRLENERKHINKLAEVIMRTGLSSSKTHIQSIQITGNENARNLSRKLACAGHDVRAILSPTVRRGHELLRISLHSFNPEAELKELINHIKTYKKI